MPFWPYPSGYPTALDNFSVSQIDGVDVVWANHPNALASAVAALQAKLNITNALIQGPGGLEFDPTGHAANPGVGSNPTIWLDNSSGPGFAIMYTDDLGTDYDLRNAASAGFIGYGYTCPLGVVLGDLAHITSVANTIVLANATTTLKANGMIIDVYGGGTSCDIAYRAEVSGLAGLVPETEYFLGDAGAYVIEAAIPGTTTVKQYVGTARSTTTMVFNPTLATEV